MPNPIFGLLSTNEHDSLQYLKKLGFTIPEYKSLNFTSQFGIYRKQWSDKKLFTNYSTDEILVKINFRKLRLITENLMALTHIGQRQLSIS